MSLILKGFNGEGRFYMTLIMVLGLISLAIIAERFVYIFVKSSKGRAEFMRNLGKLLQAGKTEDAARLAAKGTTPESKMISAVL